MRLLGTKRRIIVEGKYRKAEFSADCDDEMKLSPEQVWAKRHAVGCGLWTRGVLVLIVVVEVEASMSGVARGCGWVVGVSERIATGRLVAETCRT